MLRICFMVICISNDFYQKVTRDYITVHLIGRRGSRLNLNRYGVCPGSTVIHYMRTAAQFDDKSI
ncbi:hypothetical protein NEISICOT_00221 [Neisseria sicca ATCC 29256]|uniref:Uncharacterized protein n=1 Tax=Neisseria sicca ATCC 29256 TaxID=547045 RepID=C6M141_NEISI|nr:hypothetical protein NEISICOT_00221 [Neisseria sicca ATCC 29256]